MNYLERLQACVTPSDLSKLHLETAYEFAKLSDDYEKYLPTIIHKKRALMEEHKTVAKAEQHYELSDEGQWEHACRIRLKAYEKVLSGIKQRLATLDSEAKNQW